MFALVGGLEGLDPPAGSRGSAPGGGVGAKPPAGCAWSVRDCSGNPAGSRFTNVLRSIYVVCRLTFIIRYRCDVCRGIVAKSPTPPFVFPGYGAGVRFFFFSGVGGVTPFFY